ncbi:MAG: serine hydroxymethyltransferase [Rickettsiaceae bacterium 4572_127]|nr:MAG: serine hydroxymethyltransferase [Rickettsiaceae bacterium 4572_127]
MILDFIKKEEVRQNETINLIASENFVSDAVRLAQGSVLTNKYAEGYPSARYFKCKFANVQPHSGANANLAVLLATLKVGDTIMGMDLKSGGHLSHGSKPNLSGKWFNSVPYSVSKKNYKLDYDEIMELAKKTKPQLIIAGGSAYPFQIDFKKFREIADKVGAILVADIAHIAGLIVGECHDSPFPFADIVTTTTHKTLRGARGGMILTNDENLAKKINSAVFPGTQGGPLMHAIAGKGVAFEEALQPDFKTYAKQIVENAKTLAETLMSRGLTLIGGGTETHLMLVDLRPLGLTGAEVATKLEENGIVCNKNGLPFDTASPRNPSGIRLGTPAMTTKGWKEKDFEKLGNKTADLILSIKP